MTRTCTRPSRTSTCTRPKMVLFHALPCHRSHICGYDLNLTYPQNGHFPSLANVPLNSEVMKERTRKTALLRNLLKADAQLARRTLLKRNVVSSVDPDPVLTERKAQWKRDLVERSSGLDSTYECDLWDELLAYALEFSFPWGEFRLFHIFKSR